jgi:dienelactone hydrolase
MKKLLILALFIPRLLVAQTYRQLADSALHVMNEPRGDSIGNITAYPKAYALYQQAFSKFPAEADRLGYYKAGYLAGELNKPDEAFMYLNKVVLDMDFYDLVVSKYARGEFSKLINDPRWNVLVSKARIKKQAHLTALKNQQKTLEAQGILNRLDFSKDDGRAAYQKIKHYNQYPTLTDQYLSLQVPLTDTLHTAFLVALPRKYNPAKAYAVLFFLHGAVNSNTGYLDEVDKTDLGGWNRYYTKYAAGDDVIMIYPHANRDYNWMYPDKGFFMIPAILKQVRQVIHVDDDKIFISGHSNGATGSFSYLMKQPSPFAGFYGFNTRPRVATGGTYIRNILNRSFFNVSVDQDYYYPPAAHDSLTATMKRLGADYQDHRYNGFPHWFPQFDASEPAYELLFNDIAKRKRNPFHHSVYWECDDVQYGTCDWIKITGLDTAAKRADWQQNINFPIKKWIVLDKNNNAHERDTLLNAFKYIKQSGAIKATYKDNVFTIETSDIHAFSILISPEMVNLSKPITVIVNGKLYNKKQVNYDKGYMLNGFKAMADRTAIWVNHIDVKL